MADAEHFRGIITTEKMYGSNDSENDESWRKPRWWLIVTAAVLAVLTLYYYTGSWTIVVLFFAAFGAFVGFQKIRARRSALPPNKRPSV